MFKRKALFFDRDDTLIVDTGYIKSVENITLIENSAELLSYLFNEKEFLLFIISNQSGISRGLMSVNQVNFVNDFLIEEYSKFNVYFNAIYFCPYHPDIDGEEKSICRKPNPYMIVKASCDFNIDLRNSFMIGDKISDVVAGNLAGLKTVLFDYKKKLVNYSMKNTLEYPNFIAYNFKEVTEYIAGTN